MPDDRTHGTDRCGEELRLTAAHRLRRRRLLARLLLIASICVPVLWSAGSRPGTVLLWNPTPSAPTGLYAVLRDRPAGAGDMVIAWTPEPARGLAARRGYVPANVPLVKRVAASAGDHVCSTGEVVTVNAIPAAVRRRKDARGRTMPGWSGCRRLAPGEYLLLMGEPLSFDGRYFGITLERDMVGRARLLWAV